METKPPRSEIREDKDGREKASRWDNKVEFFMAAISSTVGLGNLWRFPYIVYRNGGGAFLIPYVLMIIFIGFPFVTLDLTLGQYGRKGPFGVWNLCPLFQGIGWSMCIMNFLCNTYFVMLMAYAIFYVFASFSSDLPWTRCDNEWNTENCVDEVITCQRSGGSWGNGSCTPSADLHEITPPPWDQFFSSPSEEYFNNRVLGLSYGIDDLGGVQWRLALCLLLAWTLIVVWLSLGTKSWGKLSYVTALLPYVVMFTLLIQACVKTGAGGGILFLITPSWDRLGNWQTWSDAAIQVFFSLGCGCGSFITLGKHNRFRNNPIIDAGILVLIDFFTSIFCGLVIFAILGQMAAQLNVPISAVDFGPGLAFIIIPQAVTALPAPQLWSGMFFLMMLNLGLGSAVPMMANILGSITEEIKMLDTKLKRFITLVCLAAVSFIFGLVYTTGGGIYVLTLVDYYTSIPWLVIGFLEVLIISWFYGSGSLLKNIASMAGWRPNYLHYFTVFWRAVCPIFILAALVTQSVMWRPAQYSDYMFPVSANIMGWLVTFSVLLPILVVFIFRLCMAPSRQELRNVIRPTASWGAEARQSQNTDVIYPTTDTLITSKV